jgi:hypothetical protein
MDIEGGSRLTPLCSHLNLNLNLNLNTHHSKLTDWAKACPEARRKIKDKSLKNKHGEIQKTKVKGQKWKKRRMIFAIDFSNLQ